MDYYAVEAIKKERSFLKKSVEKTLRTCMGKANIIVEVSKTAIFIKTEKSTTPFKVSRERLRAAMREFLYRRHLSRADLGNFCNYNSALMAILMGIFADSARVQKTVRYGFRLVLLGIRWFAAGGDRAVRDLEVAASQNLRFVLMSYYHLRSDKKARWKYHVQRLGLKVLLDSGEFSRYRAVLKGKMPKPIYVEEYAEFIRQHSDVIFGYVNLDRIDDAVQTKQNAALLIALTGNPNMIPVWHCQSSFDDLEELLAEEVPLIAIGGSVFLSEKKRKAIFDELFRRFPNGCFHGLGVSSSLIHKYPWFSIDSSSWLAGRKYGRLLTPSGQVKAPRTWSNEECLAFNVRYLTSLENPYGVQFSSLISPIAI